MALLVTDSYGFTGASLGGGCFFSSFSIGTGEGAFLTGIAPGVSLIELVLVIEVVIDVVLEGLVL